MNLTVVGLGLIGGSVATDLKACGFVKRIFGVEKSSSHAAQALKLGLVDEVLDLKNAVGQADLVVITTPVDVITKILPQILDHLPENSVVTDTGSTKKSVCDSVSKHKRRPSFVASHPMAGTENSGPTAALKGLFAGKTTVICEKESSEKKALKTVEDMYDALQMRRIYMNVTEHDLHTAFVSHLSHISSFVLSNTVLAREKNNKAIFDLAGGGFESTVRLAKSSPEMWTPIFEQNKENIIDALDAYMEHLEEFRQSVIKNEWSTTSKLMERANEIRRVLETMRKTAK